MKITFKRAYDTPSPDDGYRVLVDRLWPRGVKKQELEIDEWHKDIAPSTELRQWFNHDPDRFAEFSAKYQHELSRSSAPRQLLERANGSDQLTLVYAAKDPAINHAVVLRDYLADLR